MLVILTGRYCRVLEVIILGSWGTVSNPNEEVEYGK
jgi:hypothetical protein